MKERLWSATSRSAFSFLPPTPSQKNWSPLCLPSPLCRPNTSQPEACIEPLLTSKDSLSALRENGMFFLNHHVVAGLFYLTTIFLKGCHSERSATANYPYRGPKARS